MHFIATLRKLVTARVGDSFYSVIEGMLNEYYIPLLERQIEDAEDTVERDWTIERLEEWKTLYDSKLWEGFLYRALKKFHIDPRQFKEYESSIAFRVFNRRESIYQSTNPLKMHAKYFSGSYMFTVIKGNLIDSMREVEKQNQEQNIPIPESGYTPTNEVEYKELEQEFFNYVKSKDTNRYKLLLLWLNEIKINPEIIMADVIKPFAKKLKISEPTAYLWLRLLKNDILSFFRQRDYHVPKKFHEIAASESNITDRVAYSHFKMLVGKSIFWNTGIL